MAAEFRRFVRDINAGKVLVPAIRAALSNPKFKGFTVPVEGWDSREYDGWFHPSSQATWTPRQLYYYLTAPDMFDPEPPTPLFVLAVTQGKFWHEFIQRLLLDLSLLVPNKGSTRKDDILKRAEISLVDKEINVRGHADGRLQDGNLFEFKTMSDYKIKKVKSFEDIKVLEPGYYAQTQDYLAIDGAEEMRYVIMSLASPFPMEEIVVPADKAFQAEQREKYLEATQAAADQRPPSECCAPRSKEAKACPARLVCPIGRVS